MPRPNRPRSIASEQALARRLAFERERKGMSYDGLASRMTKAGCPIQASGLYKIEKAGRRITVDELVAFSHVFDIPIEKLLLPPELAAGEVFTDLMVAWNRKRESAAAAQAEESEAWQRMRNYIDEHPEVAEVVEPVIAGWVDAYFEQEKREGALAMWMHRLTEAPEWEARVREWLDKDSD